MPSVFTLEGRAIPNGRSKGYQAVNFDPMQLAIGTRVELEHTIDPAVAQRIAMDHLAEDRNYYKKLARVHLDGRLGTTAPEYSLLTTAPHPTPPKQRITSRRFSIAPISRQFSGPGLDTTKLLMIGGAVAASGLLLWLARGKRGGKRRLGESMLKTIAREAKTPAEFARRADAWNASEGRPLPAAKLARAYRKASPAQVSRLLRQAREERLEKREGLWTSMSRGLRGLLG